MPRRNDLHRILVIGPGPIVIGQGAEFDYSGTQAAKALKEEGYEVILVNSNPATIMTDPEFADRTYIEPVTAEFVALVIEKEKPDALLPTMGGQTALNVAMELYDSGVLEANGVALIGADARAIRMAEDRGEFAEAMRRIGLAVPIGGIATSYDEALALVDLVGFPAIIRPAFTLGGTGGGIAYNRDEYEGIVRRGLELSPVSQVLIERSVIGWKEFELEVMRDGADNVVIVCSIENLDPMGVHTGDSITVAPAMTLTDREYQRMRDAAIAIIREIGVEAGGCNIQLAANPAHGETPVIRVNPPVSRPAARRRRDEQRVDRRSARRAAHADTGANLPDQARPARRHDRRGDRAGIVDRSLVPVSAPGARRGGTVVWRVGGGRRARAQAHETAGVFRSPAGGAAQHHRGRRPRAALEPRHPPRLQDGRYLRG